MERQTQTENRYRVVSALKPDQSVLLIMDNASGEYYVQKEIAIYNIDIYRFLTQHPLKGVPRIEALREDEDRLVIWEQYIYGNSLQTVLDSAGSISPDLALQYISELCSIVEQLHAQHPPIIHRDIKPSNVLIAGDRSVWLLDFNAAKYSEPAQERDTRLLGTPGFAAPEQYGFGASTVQTDIYAIGALLNTLLTGDVSPVYAKDARVFAILDRCLEMNPEDRYSSVSELKQAVDDVRLNPFQEDAAGADASPADTAPAGAYAAPARRAGRSPQIHPNALPGFRTGKLYKMVIAVAGYLFILYETFILDFPRKDNIYVQVVYRFTAFYMMFSAVLIICNYGKIQKLMPLCSSENRVVRWTGVILEVALFSVVLPLIWVFLAGAILAALGLYWVQ